MDLGLKGRTAIVTGGSKGIGRSIALVLAAEGANVVVAARGQAGVDDCVAEIAKAGGAAIGVAADTADPETGNKLAQAAIERFGKVDVVVNNAGGQRRRAPFDELNDQDFLDAFTDNVLSVVRMVRAALPSMRAQKWGRIVNIISEVATQPDRVSQHYNAAKAGELNLTKSLSQALARDGILVNAVAPGLIATPGIEDRFAKGAEKSGRSVDEEKKDFFKKFKPGLVLQRAGDPDEVAWVVAMLCSDRCSYVTGANFRVDGGSVIGIN